MGPLIGLLPLVALVAASASAAPQYRMTLHLKLETSWYYEKNEGVDGLCRSSTRGAGGWTLSLDGSVVTARPRSATLLLRGRASRFGGHQRTRCTSPTSAIATDGDCFRSRTPIERAHVRIGSRPPSRLRLRGLSYEVERSRLWCLPPDVELPPGANALVERPARKLPVRALRAGRRVALSGHAEGERRAPTSEGGEWSLVELVEWRLELVRVR